VLLKLAQVEKKGKLVKKTFVFVILRHVLCVSLFRDVHAKDGLDDGELWFFTSTLMYSVTSEKTEKPHDVLGMLSVKLRSINRKVTPLRKE
jgi:hypothetical protein